MNGSPSKFLHFFQFYWDFSWSKYMPFILWQEWKYNCKENIYDQDVFINKKLFKNKSNEPAWRIKKNCEGLEIKKEMKPKQI